MHDTMLQQDPQCNYYEFVYLPSSKSNRGDAIATGSCTEPTPGSSVNIQLSEREFQALLDRVKRAKLKPSSRAFKCYIKDSLHMDAEEDGEVRVWECVPTDCSLVSGGSVLALKYRRNKMPMHAFPCTTALHHVYHSRSLVFRLHNRVFLNFEVQHDPHTSATVYKVFVNYNHDENVDTKTIQERLAQAFQLLGVPFVFRG